MKKFEIDALVATKILADLAEETSAPVAHKAGRHPEHLRGRERSIADKRFGASAKKCRKDYCGTRKAEWYDACSYHSGKEFSAKRRSILVVEDYNPEFERILGAYGVADVEELLILSSEAHERYYAAYDEWWALRDRIRNDAGALAAHWMDSYYEMGAWITNPVEKYAALFEKAQADLLDEKDGELDALEEKFKAEMELRDQLIDVYKHLTSKRN